MKLSLHQINQVKEKLEMIIISYEQLLSEYFLR